MTGSAASLSPCHLAATTSKKMTRRFSQIVRNLVGLGDQHWRWFRALVLVDFLLLFPLSVFAEHKVDVPEYLTEHLAGEIRILADEPIGEVEFPEHPKVYWLDAVPEKLEYGSFPHAMTIRLVPRGPGQLVLPPIPMMIGDQRILIELPVFEVADNPVTEKEARLIAFYNSAVEPPSEVHVGEKIDFDILALSPPGMINSQVWDQPEIDLTGIVWRRYVLTRFVDFENYFHIFQGRPYVLARGEIEGVNYSVRRFKCRAYFSEVGDLKGKIHLSIPVGATTLSGFFGNFRHDVIPLSMTVLPLPPAPNTGAFSTGLVGDWEFSLTVTPERPGVGEAIKLTVDIFGDGDPLALNELDFSGPGFPSSGTTLKVLTQPMSEHWHGQFEQELVPTGDVPRLPPITLASFDTEIDAWVEHRLSESIVIAGAKSLGSSGVGPPALAFGPAVQRPVISNLHPLAFVLFAIGPILPIAVFVGKRLVALRDVDRAKRRSEARSLVSELRDSVSSEQIDERLLPLLREHAKLPAGATAGEVADAYQAETPDLAKALRQHAENAFRTGGSEVIDPKRIVSGLSKIAFVLAVGGLTLGSARAVESMESAASAFDAGRFDEAAAIYREMAAENPEYPAVHVNLAKAYLAKADAPRAWAASHTAMLLDPRDSEVRSILKAAREGSGESALPGAGLLVFRPDRLLFAAAVLWFLGFVALAIGRARWVSAVLIVAALAVAVVAQIHNSRAYAEGQFMVVTDGLPREPVAGEPDLSLPTLDAGQLFRPTEWNDTHALIDTTGGAPFWLPLQHLERVW